MIMIIKILIKIIFLLIYTYLKVFWAFGSTFEVALAYLILPNYGWRWLVCASAIPIGFFLILLKVSFLFQIRIDHFQK